MDMTPVWIRAVAGASVMLHTPIIIFHVHYTIVAGCAKAQQFESPTKYASSTYSFR
jgi:hypothetical protein